MTGLEIAELISYMASTWRVEFTRGQAKVWEETLDPLHGPTAARAMTRLKKSSEFVPSHAKFLAEYDEQRFLAEMPERPMLAIDRPRAPKLPPEEAKRRFDAMRALLPQNRVKVDE